MNVDSLASEAFAQIPGTRLAGVMDLETGLFLSLKAGECDLEQADLLAASAREIFDGPLSAGLRCSLGPRGPQSVEQVVVVGSEVTFVFARVGSNEENALVVACTAEGGLGMTLSRARQVARNG